MIKILLADDVQLYLALEKTFLARRDYEFLTATQGADAWDLLAQHRPQLSIVELGLPGMGALELRRRQLDTPELAGIPMVVTTTGTDNGVHEEAKRLGIGTILQKPFNVEVLTHAVQAVLPAQRRKFPRHPIHLDVNLHIDRSYRDGTTIDVSIGGLLLVVDEPLSMGQSMKIQLSIPGADEPVRGAGRVIRYAKERRAHGRCYGFEFLEMAEPDVERLSRFLQDLSAR